MTPEESREELEREIQGKSIEEQEQIYQAKLDEIQERQQEWGNPNITEAKLREKLEATNKELESYKKEQASAQEKFDKSREKLQDTTLKKESVAKNYTIVRKQLKDMDQWDSLVKQQLKDKMHDFKAQCVAKLHESALAKADRLEMQLKAHPNEIPREIRPIALNDWSFTLRTGISEEYQYNYRFHRDGTSDPKRHEVKDPASAQEYIDVLRHNARAMYTDNTNQKISAFGRKALETNRKEYWEHVRRNEKAERKQSQAEHERSLTILNGAVSIMQSTELHIQAFAGALEESKYMGEINQLQKNIDKKISQLKDINQSKKMAAMALAARAKENAETSISHSDIKQAAKEHEGESKANKDKRRVLLEQENRELEDLERTQNLDTSALEEEIAALNQQKQTLENKRNEARNNREKYTRERDNIINQDLKEQMEKLTILKNENEVLLTAAKENHADKEMQTLLKKGKEIDASINKISDFRKKRNQSLEDTKKSTEKWANRLGYLQTPVGKLVTKYASKLASAHIEKFDEIMEMVDSTFDSVSEIMEDVHGLHAQHVNLEKENAEIKNALGKEEPEAEEAAGEDKDANYIIDKLINVSKDIHAKVSETSTGLLKAQKDLQDTVKLDKDHIKRLDEELEELKSGKKRFVGDKHAMLSTVQKEAAVMLQEHGYVEKKQDKHVAFEIKNPVTFRVKQAKADAEDLYVENKRLDAIKNRDAGIHAAHAADVTLAKRRIDLATAEQIRTKDRLMVIQRKQELEKAMAKVHDLRAKEQKRAKDFVTAMADPKTNQGMIVLQSEVYANSSEKRGINLLNRLTGKDFSAGGLDADEVKKALGSICLAGVKLTSELKEGETLTTEKLEMLGQKVQAAILDTYNRENGQTVTVADQNGVKHGVGIDVQEIRDANPEPKKVEEPELHFYQSQKTKDRLTREYQNYVHDQAAYDFIIERAEAVGKKNTAFATQENQTEMDHSQKILSDSPNVAVAKKIIPEQTQDRVRKLSYDEITRKDHDAQKPVSAKQETAERPKLSKTESKKKEPEKPVAARG